MPKTRPTLDADLRTIIGKKVKHLRRDGKVPAVIYGTLVDEPISVTLDTRDLYRTYIDYGNISLIDVTLNGDVHTVYIRNVQQHPISREPLHAELYAPNLTVSMTAAVPVILVGESPNPDGAVTQLRDNIELEGLPTDLPGAVEVDVSGLEEFGDAVMVSDLQLPAEVTLVTDPEEMIVRLMEVRIIEEEEEPEELEEGELPEGEEGEEGEAAEGEEGEADEDEESE